MVLILSLVYQKIGTSKAMLKRKVLIRIMERPNIKGGEFIVGSLKIRSVFFSKTCPIASVINFEQIYTLNYLCSDLFKTL